jgi:hypothetical protein
MMDKEYWDTMERELRDKERAEALVKALSQKVCRHKSINSSRHPNACRKPCTSCTLPGMREQFNLSFMQPHIKEFVGYGRKQLRGFDVDALLLANGDRAVLKLVVDGKAYVAEIEPTTPITRKTVHKELAGIIADSKAKTEAVGGSEVGTQ